MGIPANLAYNNIISRFSVSPGEIVDIKSYIKDLVNNIYTDYEPSITERASTFQKIVGRDTGYAESLSFHERRIVVAYNYLHDDAQYIHIVIALMKDLPKDTLSIRKAIFLFDAHENMLFKVENEIPEA